MFRRADDSRRLSALAVPGGKSGFVQRCAVFLVKSSGSKPGAYIEVDVAEASLSYPALDLTFVWAPKIGVSRSCPLVVTMSK